MNEFSISDIYSNSYVVFRMTYVVCRKLQKRLPFTRQPFILKEINLLIRPQILFVVEDFLFNVFTFQQCKDRIFNIPVDKHIVGVVDGRFDDSRSKHSAFEQFFPAHSGAEVFTIVNFVLSQHWAKIRVIYPEHRSYSPEGAIIIGDGFYRGDTQNPGIHSGGFFIEDYIFFNPVSLNQIRVKFWTDYGIPLQSF